MHCQGNYFVTTDKKNTPDTLNKTNESMHHIITPMAHHNTYMSDDSRVSNFSPNNQLVEQAMPLFSVQEAVNKSTISSKDNAFSCNAIINNDSNQTRIVNINNAIAMTSIGTNL